MKRSTDTQILRGIVIRLFPSGDADLVLRIITEHEGKVAVIAKHARRGKPRFSFSLDLFDHGNFEVRGDLAHHDRLLNLAGFSPAKGFRQLREDLNKFAAAGTLVECVDLLHPERTHDSSGYELTRLGLEAIAEARDDREVFRACFLALASLLERAGYLNLSGAPAPSSHGLLALIDAVEKFTDREVVSKGSLREAFRSLQSA